MPLVEFELMFPVIDRVITFHALDLAATVIGAIRLYGGIIKKTRI
jgi:hypothetical protein